MTGEEGGSMTDFDAARAAYGLGDYKKAFDCWHRAANAGDTDAQSWLGSLYANGEGVEVNDQAALKWYLKAAEQGNHMAQANVGAFYFMGRGTAKNPQEAVRWLTAAAEGADQNGLFNLGVLYSKGEGVPLDNAKAAEMYRRAAELGHYPSQSRIGYMYAQGKGVEKDRVQAYLWLSLAAQHGIGTALNELESVVKEMSLEEKSNGANLFETWRQRTKSRANQVALYPVPS